MSFTSPESPMWEKKEKQRNQVKSRFYYLFWGIATFSVVAGQIYVGSGYRLYARSLMRIFDTIDVEIQRDYNNERFYQMTAEIRYAILMLFSAKWNVPEAAKHCGLSKQQMKVTFNEYCSKNGVTYVIFDRAIQLQLDL